MAKVEDVKINTRATKDAPKRDTIVQYTFAESLAECVQMYGENLVKLLVNKAVRVGAQAAGRPLLAENKSHEEIQAAVSNYRPEETSRRGRVKYIADMASLKEQFATMPQEERQKMLALFEAYISGGELPTETPDANGDDDEDEDDDEEGDEPGVETGSPPANANRAQQQRKRGPTYT